MSEFALMNQSDTVLEKRINRVLDYIQSHLEDDLSLKVLAQVAGLSAFHFHRLFKRQVGVGLNTFVVRQRLERAAKLLHSQTSLSLTQIALETGFESLSDFSRNFKAQYGIPASRWNRRSPLQLSKIRQTELGLPLYTDSELEAMPWAVEVQQVASRTLVYLRVKNPYFGSRLVDGLTLFGEQLEVLGLEPIGELLGMSLNDPEVTPLQQCFYDWAIPIINPPKRLGRLNVYVQPRFQVAKIAVKGDIYDVDRAWQYLYHAWLPKSRYLPDELPAMEVYQESPQGSDWQHWNLQCWLPIRETLI